MTQTKSRKSAAFRARLRTLLPLALFAAALILFLSGITSVSSVTLEKQQESLENALRRAIVHCYATEGRYPESLLALVQRYGITYDSERYFVDYQPIGTNLMPDVTVVPRSQGGGR